MKMKRPLAIGCVASLAIVTGFSSCGKAPEVCDPGNYLPGPQLCPDVASLGFGLEFRTGTTIGTRPQNTISIVNGGLADLQVSSAVKRGDGAFTLDLTYDLADGGSGTTLPGPIPAGKHLFLRVIFAPTQARAYTGSVLVLSNAENQPDGGFVFGLSGCGIPADGGTSPCYYDGGMP